jgi:Domain of unknown function (DUF5666)
MNRSRWYSAALAAALAATVPAGALAQQPSPEATPAPAPKRALPVLNVRAPNEVSGTIRAIDGNVLTVQTRTGQTVRVDASEALAHEQSTVLLVGRPVDVRGTYDANRVLHAQVIVRAKSTPAVWRPDR